MDFVNYSLNSDHREVFKSWNLFTWRPGERLTRRISRPSMPFRPEADPTVVERKQCNMLTFLLHRKINCSKLVWNSIINVSLLRIYCNLYLFLTDYPYIWKELHFIFSGGHLFMLVLPLQSDLGCSNYGIWRAKQIYSCWNRGKGKITSGCSTNSRERTGL